MTTASSGSGGVRRLAFDRTTVADERARGLGEHCGVFRAAQNTIAVGAVVEGQAADFGGAPDWGMPDNVVWGELRHCGRTSDHASDGIANHRQRNALALDEL